MVLAHQFTPEAFFRSLGALVILSLTASSAYIFNDLRDLPADRAHPRKRKRPLASGELAVAHGIGLGVLLLLLGLALSPLVSWKFALVLLAYALAAAVYSLVLKQWFVIDICTLAGLYTLRVVAGGAATGISLSVWLLAFSIFFFFSLAAVKRQAELSDRNVNGEARVHGRGYDVGDLPLVANMALSSGYLSVLVMALYLDSANVQALYEAAYPLWGLCPILLYWISRMVLITNRGEMHDDPLIFALRDRPSIVCLATIVALVSVSALL